MEGFIVLCFFYVQIATGSVSNIHMDSGDGVNQSTCWAGGEQQPCELMGSSSALILNRPKEYTTISENSCAYSRQEVDYNSDVVLHKGCPTWFRRSGSINSSRCERGSISKVEDILRYHQNNSTSILNCHCMTLENNTTTIHDNVTRPGQMLVGACLYNCFNETSYSPSVTPYHPLPLDPQKLNNVMCERYNRRGRLCAECKEGYHHPVYSYKIMCIKCTFTRYNPLFYILVAFGPLTVFLFFMLICRVNAATPPLSIHIQLMQLCSCPSSLRALIGAIGTSSDLKNWIPIVKFMATIYGVWNLDFFRTVIPPICLNISTLQALSLDYIIAVYPLALTVVIYALIELHAHNVRVLVWLWRPFHKYLFLYRRQWNIKSSIAGTFASFMLLSYIKFANVSFDLLFPVRVYDMDGQVVTYLYYDATIEYFGQDHLLYAILAIVICIIFLILPIVFLLLYPFSFFRKCLHALRLQSSFIDNTMQIFLYCFKDGTEGTASYQWFAVMQFILRGVLLLSYAATRSFYFWSIASIEIILFCFLLITVQPYKLNTHNIIEVSQFLLISMFSVSMVGINAATIESPRHFTASVTTVAITIFLPVVFSVGIALHWLQGKKNIIVVAKQATSQAKRYLVYTFLRCTFQPTDLASPVQVDSLPDRLMNPSSYSQQETLCSGELSASCD